MINLATVGLSNLVPQNTEKKTQANQVVTLAAVKEELGGQYRARFDSFYDQVVIVDDLLDDQHNLDENDITDLVMTLEAKYKLTGVDRARVAFAIERIARDDTFDSAKEWVTNAKRGDGTINIDNFLHAVCGVDDTEYHRAVSRYIWLAFAGRVLDPGCKVDGVMMLTGSQGKGKSSLIENIVWDRNLYVGFRFNIPAKERSLKMIGRLAVEISEYGNTERRQEDIKEFITQRAENYRPNFVKYYRDYNRRCVFIGTTNSDSFLCDETGERRWFPVKIEKSINIEQLRANRESLWAEARDAYSNDALWQAYELANSLADDAREQNKAEIPWIPLFVDMFESPSRTYYDRSYITYADVKQALPSFAMSFASEEAAAKYASRVFTVMGWDKRVVSKANRYYRPK